MARRTTWVLGGVAATVIVLVGAVAVWFFVLRDDAPPPVALEDAVGQVVTTVAAGSDDPVADPTAPVAPDDDPPLDVGLDGTWNVDTGFDSFVGYRVQEELANFGGNTAAGRTLLVSGSLEIEGSTITEVAIEADLTGLVSDDTRRDRQLRSRGLQTAEFPTSSFTLTEPIELDAIPALETPIRTAAVGELSLHGVARAVEVAIEAQQLEGVIAVVGSIGLDMTDYGIEPPTGFSVLSIDENAVVEFQLFFTK